MQTKYRKDRTQSLCIKKCKKMHKKENVNWAIKEVLEIVTRINYPKHQSPMDTSVNSCIIV